MVKTSVADGVWYIRASYTYMHNLSGLVQSSWPNIDSKVLCGRFYILPTNLNLHIMNLTRDFVIYNKF